MNTQQIADLKAFFKYDPETGNLTWLKSPYTTGIRARSNMEGVRAGGPTTDGKTRVSLKKTSFYVEKIAFALMTGKVPKFINHKNRNPGDDRWCNLEGSDVRSELGNNITMSNNLSGYRGVFESFYIWRAKIGHKGKGILLGSFEDKDIAAIVYNVAAVKYHGDRAVLNHVVI